MLAISLLIRFCSASTDLPKYTVCVGTQTVAHVSTVKICVYVRHSVTVCVGRYHKDVGVV